MEHTITNVQNNTAKEAGQHAAMASPSLSPLPGSERNPDKASAVAEHGKRQHSRGEKAYTWLVDVLVNFVVNSAVSVAFTYAFKHKFKGFSGKVEKTIGKWDWDSCTDKMGHLVETLVPMWKSKSTNPAEIHTKRMSTGEWGMNLTALSAIGWVLLYPIKKFEWRKLETVKWLDKQIDRISKPGEDELKKRDAAYQDLATQEHPTWPTIVWSRILGWGAFNVVATYAFSAANQKFLGPKGANLTSGKTMGEYGKGFAKRAVDLFSKQQQGKSIAQLEKAKSFRIWDITYGEIVGCGLTAFGVRFVLNRLMGWKQKKADRAHAAGIDTGGSTMTENLTAPRDEATLPLKSPQEATAPLRGHRDKFTPAGSHADAALRQEAATGLSL